MAGPNFYPGLFEFFQHPMESSSQVDGQRRKWLHSDLNLSAWLYFQPDSPGKSYQSMRGAGFLNSPISFPATAPGAHVKPQSMHGALWARDSINALAHYWWHCVWWCFPSLWSLENTGSDVYKVCLCHRSFQNIVLTLPLQQLNK